MRYNLFIDDERDPKDVTWLSPSARYAHLNYEWYIVRSYAEAFELILTFGCMPEAVSFDHDLGENLPTGYDIAKRMIELAMDAPDAYSFPEKFHLIVHSKNPVGKANIESYFKSYFDQLRA